MIVASEEQGERRTNVVVIRCVIGLMALSFIGCQTPEPETVEFKPTGEWELEEEIREAESRSSQPSNPNLEAIGNAFSGF